MFTICLADLINFSSLQNPQSLQAVAYRGFLKGGGGIRPQPNTLSGKKVLTLFPDFDPQKGSVLKKKVFSLNESRIS